MSYYAATVIQHIQNTVNTVNLTGARVEKIVYENVITIRSRIAVFRKAFQTSEVQAQ